MGPRRILSARRPLSRRALLALSSTAFALGSAALAACASLAGIDDAYGTNGASPDGAIADGAPDDATAHDGDAVTDASPLVDAGPFPGPALMIAVGGYHACAVTAQSTYCWGLNSSGQLGDGTTTDRHTATVVKGLGSVPEAIVAGAGHTCVLVDGGVSCWGQNQSYECGQPTGQFLTSPTPVQGLGTVTQISAGRYHTCALAAAQVYCWGSNSNGQLASIDAGSQRNAPGLVQGLPPIAALAVSSSTSYAQCAVDMDGNLWCWGGSGSGQVDQEGGVCHAVNAVYSPMIVPGLPAASQASDGFAHACIIASDGGVVMCWGNDFSGELGNGVGGVSCSTPVVAAGTLGSTSVSAGQNFTCSVASGGASCWGPGATYALGNGTTDNELVPTPVSNLQGVTAISAGVASACAIAEGGVWCWGEDSYGELGNGAVTPLDAGQDSSLLAPVLVGGF